MNVKMQIVSALIFVFYDFFFTWKVTVLQSRFGSNVKMKNQHQEYKLVKINTNKIESIHDRFYIGLILKICIK